MRPAKLLFALTVVALSAGVSCFDRPGSTRAGRNDGGLVRYADWGSFLPGAGSSHTPQDVSRAFGPADGDMLHLGSGGVLTVSFGDNLIYDGPGADFLIHGTFESGEAVTVFGSEDGGRYVLIGTAAAAGPTVDLAEAGLRRVIYLQIQDSGAGNGVEIDAVEVLSD